MKTAIYWFRYGLASVVMIPVLVGALALGLFVRLGTFCDSVLEALGSWDLYPARPGAVCRFCRGCGRIERPSDNDTVASARRRAGLPAKEDTNT